MDATEIDLDNLRVDVIDTASREFDFSEGYGETWEFTEAIRCEDCGAAIIYGEDHDEIEDVDEPGETRECPNDGQDSRDLYAEGPMMNYLYPLGDGRRDADDLARLLVDTPLVVITDTYGNVGSLALSGGGMDLSWEIAEAFMLAGFLPPTYVRLPAMCGRGADAYDDEGRARDARIVAAVIRSNEIMARWATQRAEDARRTGEWVNVR